MEDVYEFVSKEDIEIAEKCLNSDEELLPEIMKEKFAEKTPEELSDCLDGYLYDVKSYRDIAKSVPDYRLLLDRFDSLDNNQKGKFLSCLSKEQVVEYMNENGKTLDSLLVFLGKCNTKVKLDVITSLNSDSSKTKMLILGKMEGLFPMIKDLYYKNQITKANSEFKYKSENLLSEMEIYHKHLSELSKIEDEEDKAKYISEIGDNEVKDVLLVQIKEKKNRKIVVDSFKRDVDPEISEIDNLARTMITEFFNDRLGEKFTDEKKEKLQIVFNRTSVSFDDLESGVNGQADHLHKTIAISNNQKDNPHGMIGYMIHEYAHLMSAFDHNYTGLLPAFAVEEGMADTFADLVINNYLEKHNDVVLNGEKLESDKPYVTESGYDFENAWARTMLLGLEPKGKDIEAISEYLLGNKNKYAEMVFGKEAETKKAHTPFGTTVIETDLGELYNSQILDFSNVNEDSIYYRRNHIVPLFELQNEVGNKEAEKKIDLLRIINEGRSYYASYIAKTYFDDKKFYDVPEEDFEKFISLLDKQVVPGNRPCAIVDVDNYKKQIIMELTEEEVKENSDKIISIAQKAFGKAYEEICEGTNLEKYIKESIKKDQEEPQEEKNKQDVKLISFTSISPQMIGKATINASTVSKMKAMQVEQDELAKETKQDEAEL